MNYPLKYLNKLTPFKKTKIKKILTELINNPIQREDVKPMLGEWKGYYRIIKRVFFTIS
ncbi:MAG: hypothetical protein HON76_01010 [Candidatus Scalindua sp.]|jgi:mRNA-degrading endonuclease RelE of RelBE toxin-antitoxin system|nr:hypothetical protein [Candidatus Scalindua sp.]MBT5305223.1 hypothetical protein [Candidatus Scalindua sp.]MBT6045804.1 hypothetical protein [Candidatus Scalindua sp.]MBT6561092.1 hypothetical protein [Candidatus Scalindua sp.]